MTGTLILIPTRSEYDILQPHLTDALLDDAVVELCGFGLVAAAARTAQLIARLSPRRVLLIGIAGAFELPEAVGSAMTFREVTCCGIGVGVGAGSEHVSAEALGWKQFQGQAAEGTGEPVIGDSISLLGWGSPATRHCDGSLLSVAAASATPEEARLRRERYPGVVAEDMEGYGVAFACHLTDTRLEIVRGISNIAGNRNRAAWRVETALHAAAALAMQLSG